MKNIFFKFVTICICILCTGFGVNAWVGLTAENGDILNTAKWNELITYVDTKITGSNIIAGENIVLTLSGDDVTIDSTSIELTTIATDRDDADITATRYYGTEYSDTSWKVDKETGTGTGTIRVTATNLTNAGQATYTVAWTNRTSLSY